MSELSPGAWKSSHIGGPFVPEFEVKRLGDEYHRARKEMEAA